MKIETLTEQAAQFGIKVGILNKGLYKKLAEMIPENEQIIFAFEGISSGSVPVIISGKAVYLAASSRGAFGKNIAVIPLVRITSISAKAGAMLGAFKNISIGEGTVVHIVEGVKAKIADRAIAAINQAQASAAATASSPAAIPISQADELVKFKKLLDDGVLTQEEFDKKKAQILGI